MALQTTFDENMGSAFCGQWYDISDLDAVSRSVEISSIPFGVAVVMGSNDNQVRLPDHGGYFATLDALDVATVPAVNKFAGLTVYHSPNPRCDEAALALPVGSGDLGYLGETETASVATHGRVYVTAETDVIMGDPVFFRHTLADNAAVPQTEQLGALRNDADGALATRIAGAEFMHSALAGELTIVKLTGATQA